MTSLGPVIQEATIPLRSGESLVLPVQFPMAMLEAAACESEIFCLFLRDVLNKCGNKVSIALYTDEVTPGNALAQANLRKLQAIYWSVLEFGYPALSNENSWFTLACIRSSEVNKLDGGMSELTRYLLHQFFGSSAQPHDLRNGVLIRLPGDNSSRLVFGSMKATQRTVHGCEHPT
jgi:hypothetical protein